MSDLFFEIQEQLAPLLQAGATAECEQRLSECLAGLPKSPFHVILGLQITNSEAAVAKYFDQFFTQESERFQIAAAYTEMNGFDINTDRWYCDAFAFEEYGGMDDFDWLADWQSDDYEELTITGLEDLQAVYASKAFCDKQNEKAIDITNLLVVVKFQDLIRRSTGSMRKLRFPLLVTAHDYDFIYEARPQ